MNNENLEKRTFLGMSGKGWGIIGAIVAILGAIFFLFRRKKNPHVREK